MSQSFINLLSDTAKSHRLIFLGFTDLEVSHEFDRYRSWLEKGCTGEMHYLHQNLQLRKNPEMLLAGARSALVLAKHYGLPRDLKASVGPVIASYAYYNDYHRILRQNCQDFLKECILRKAIPEDTLFRIAIDSAPILERAIARKGGQGFIGKNTLFILPKQGSFIFLAIILSTLEAPPKKGRKYDVESQGIRDKEHGGCGTCKRCQVFCPTGALTTDYQLIADQCLSYLTIEHRGIIPYKYWRFLPRAFFGCDICQNVCPYNRSDVAHCDWPVLIPERLAGVGFYDIATMDQVHYEKFFGGTPLIRAKIFGLKRNALITLYVLKDPRLNEAIAHLLSDSELHPTLQATIKQMEGTKSNCAEPY